MKWIQSILDNNSVFGQLMTRCGILIAANILFLLFSVPVVTAGASFAALYYTMLKVLRGEDELNPFRAFWQGFRENFKQATAAWLILLALGGFLCLEIFWCSQFTGPVAMFRYGLYALLLIEIVVASYLFPTMAAFRATLPQLIQDSIFFAIRRPVTLILILFANVGPLTLTYVDYVHLPVYAFLWCIVGFAGVAMFNSSLLVKQFAPYLSPVAEDEAEGPPEKSERDILEEMKKMGM